MKGFGMRFVLAALFVALPMMTGSAVGDCRPRSCCRPVRHCQPVRYCQPVCQAPQASRGCPCPPGDCPCPPGECRGENCTPGDTAAVGDGQAVRGWKLSHGPHIASHATIVRTLEAINAHRARYGLAALVIDHTMCVEAQRHSEWGASVNIGIYQSHSNLPYRECVFAGPTSAQSCVNGWVASPPHNGILLSNATRCGIGYSDRGRRFWTFVAQ